MANNLIVAEDAGHCSNCHELRNLVIVQGLDGGIGLCRDCLFPVFRLMNEVVKNLPQDM